MAETWYDIDRNGNGRNSNAISWIQEEIKKNEIIELYKMLISNTDLSYWLIETFNNAIEQEKIDLNSRKDDILQIIKKSKRFFSRI